MKRLSIVLLALVVGVFFAGTAMAFHNGDEGTSEGALGITGKYTLDGEAYETNSGAENSWYDDDMEVVIRLNQGTVTGVIDLEITDDESFDGGNVSNKTDDNDGSLAVDNYWIQWAAMDNLTFKAGEFSFTFGAAVVIYADPAAHTFGVNYAMDAADIGFYVSKMVENGQDGDTDAFTLMANVKAVDFFSKLNFIFISGDDDLAGDTFSYLGLDSAFMAGPVAVKFEYGAVTDDVAANEGDFMLAQIGLDDLVGFDVNIDYFASGDDGTLDGRFGGGDFYPYMLAGWRDTGGFDNLSDVTLIGLSGSYALNDKTTLIGKFLLSGEAGPNDDAIGTEIDLHAKYKFDDNASVQLTYATLSPDDAYGAADDTATTMRARFTFKF